MRRVARGDRSSVHSPDKSADGNVRNPFVLFEESEHAHVIGPPPSAAGEHEGTDRV
jgi:hypothetical protein